MLPLLVNCQWQYFLLQFQPLAMFIGPLFSSPFFYHTSYFLIDFLHKNVKLQFFQAVPTRPQALIKSVHELVLFTEFFLRGILGLLSEWPPPPVSLLDHVSVAGRDWACSALCLCHVWWQLCVWQFGLMVKSRQTSWSMLQLPDFLALRLRQIASLCITMLFFKMGYANNITS